MQSIIFFKKNKQTDKEKQMSFVEDFSHLDSWRKNSIQKISKDIQSWKESSQNIYIKFKNRLHGLFTSDCNFIYYIICYKINFNKFRMDSITQLISCDSPPSAQKSFTQWYMVNLETVREEGHLDACGSKTNQMKN